LPADRTTWVVLFSKEPGSGTLTLSSSNGKYSLDGRPPPSEMIPGFFRYCAAPFSELGSLLFDSGLKRSDQTIVVSNQSPEKTNTNTSQHPINQTGQQFEINHLRSHRLAFALCECAFLPLNRSTSARAATPATRRPSAALRFATPWIVKRSGRVKVEVSDSGRTSMAAGGAIARAGDKSATTCIRQRQCGDRCDRSEFA
jgi:hypothetical protein